VNEELIRERVGDVVLESVGDELDYLRLVASADVAAREADRLLHESVSGARHAGYSWDAIGGVLGVSRQAAQQRFRSIKAEDGDGRRVITGVHALNETEILAREGRAGNHLVGFGPLYLIVEPSERQWEHKRVLGRKLSGDDWEFVGSWFPFRYYKRRLELAADGQ
jgi:hypothetical protein